MVTNKLHIAITLKRFLQLSILCSLSVITMYACNKGGGTVTPTPPPTDTTVVIDPAIDPPTAATQGFFMNDWQAKSFTAPAYNATAMAGAGGTTVTIDASSIITKIPRSTFGHNANTWMTSMVDQPIFLNHVTNLHPHIIRFPAGSGSDCYFWNAAPGKLPADVPVQLTDKDGVKKDPGFMYGKTTDNWRASLDNYYAMLLQTGNQGILTVNYGYARYGTSANPVATAAHLAADWVRYDNGRTQYWEIGNENFGDWEWGYRIDLSQNKDGQPEYLTGKLYAQHFKVFADSMKKAAAEIGKQIYIGAVTYESETQSWQTNTTKTWNSGMIPELNNKPDFYVAHCYYTPYNTNSSAADIIAAASTETNKVMSFVTNAIQTNGAIVKPIVMDEWNMFATGSKQQVSNISGIFATIILGEAIKSKYGMLARWDMLNGWSNGDDHGLFSGGDEPGVAKWSPRPSFYYMYFFQKVLGDRLVSNTVAGNTAIKAYSSTFSSGQVGATLINTSTASNLVEVKVKNFRLGTRFYWYTLEGGTDNGEFSAKVTVNGNGPSASAGGPSDYATLKANSAAVSNVIRVLVPARGAVCLVIDPK